MNSMFVVEGRINRSGEHAKFVVSIGQHTVPIEVKSSAIGHMKSLRIFMEEKKPSRNSYFHNTIGSTKSVIFNSFLFDG